MGMSTFVYGIRKPDSEWKKMVIAWKSCKDAGIDPPAELEDYFDKMSCLPPDEEIGPKIDLENLPCCAEWNAEDSKGFEVDLEKLAKHKFTHIRFYNSY